MLNVLTSKSTKVYPRAILLAWYGSLRSIYLCELMLLAQCFDFLDR
ncbi:hypothetical protein [Leptolyngbya sp. FACHB-17]|nr:hypothetical protein [Leptolyngbya sp. FACHB-17]MBD2083028.1 hypothetical protein [Leptolyngbya sp. FACHB-17]